MINPKQKFYLKESMLIVSSFCVLNYLYFFVGFFCQLELYKLEALRRYLSSPEAHMEIILSSLLYGLAFAAIHTKMENSSLRRLTYPRFTALKSLLQLIALLIGLVLVYLIVDAPEYRELWKSLPTSFYFGGLVWFVFSTGVVEMLLELRRKVGPNSFLSFLLGRFHTPHEEQRLFLFLDMVGSTTVAEKLGHRDYSRLIQRCYRHLTELLLTYDGEVHQFLGDGALLSWDATRPGVIEQCLALNRAFEDTLQAKHGDFERDFGVFPRFRAGADLGTVMATEVGTMTRVIAYHGDVLNTAARIQDQCKVHEVDLLVSERVQEKAQSSNFEFCAELQLRGKEETTKIYAQRIPT